MELYQVFALNVALTIGIATWLYYQLPTVRAPSTEDKEVQTGELDEQPDKQGQGADAVPSTSSKKRVRNVNRRRPSVCDFFLSINCNVKCTHSIDN